jgi:hypothetical protein
MGSSSGSAATTNTAASEEGAPASPGLLALSADRLRIAQDRTSEVCGYIPQERQLAGMAR